MAIQWFYQTGEGRPSGPVDSTQLRRLAEAGNVRPETLVRQGASGRWVRGEQVRGLFQPCTPAPSSSPGTTLPGPPPPKSSNVPRSYKKEDLPSSLTKSDVERILAPEGRPASGTKKKTIVFSAIVVAGAAAAMAFLALWYEKGTTNSTDAIKTSADSPQPTDEDRAGIVDSVPASDPAADGVRRILRRAQAHMDAGDSDSAIADFTEAIRLDPKDADAHYRRGLVYQEKGQHAAAERDFAEAKRLGYTSRPTPASPQQRAEAESKSVREWENDEIVGVPEGFFIDQVDAQHFDDTVQSIPQSFQGAVQQIRQGYATRAEFDSIAEIAGQQAEAESKPLPSTDVRRILSRAWAHQNAREYDRAIADFSEAIRLDPKNARAYHGRGLAYTGKDDYDSAIADYTQAIRLDPTFAGAYFGRGEAYRRKRDYDTAIADLTEAIRLDPYALAYFERGLAYSLNRDYDSAIADLTEAIRLDPTFVLAYYLRGEAYQNTGQHEAAERDFAQAKRLGYKP